MASESYLQTHTGSNYTDFCKIYGLGLICFIPQTPTTYYITLTLKNLGFSTVSLPLTPTAAN